ncbi:hypothetical protein J1N35_022875, partial [Gossypium stocksii]
LEDGWSKLHDTLRTMQKQLDLVFKAVKCQVREQALVDECVKLAKIEDEKEALYTILNLIPRKDRGCAPSKEHQKEVKNSKEVEFVIPTLMIPRKA